MFGSLNLRIFFFFCMPVHIVCYRSQRVHLLYVSYVVRPKQFEKFRMLYALFLNCYQKLLRAAERMPVYASTPARIFELPCYSSSRAACCLVLDTARKACTYVRLRVYAVRLVKSELTLYTRNIGCLMRSEPMNFEPFVKLELYFRTKFSWLIGAE